MVHAAIRAEGEFELARSSGALAWSALAAGLSMGFSMVAQGLLRSRLPDAPWSALVFRLGNSVGFLVVVLGRQQLFTENTLTVMLPLLSDFSRGRLWRVARLWAVVLAGNLVGTALFAWLATQTYAFDPKAQAAFSVLGREVLTLGFGPTFVRAILGGWLIALMVWMLPAAHRSRVAVIVVVTYVVALGQFCHCVAGSVEGLFAVWHRDASLGAYLGNFLVPALLGNTVGGVALVAGLNHAQAQRAPRS